MNSTIQNNGAGVIFFDSKNSIVRDSTFKFNGVGTWLQTNFNFEIINNTYNSNDLAGIAFEKTCESKIIGNNVEWSVNGIFLDGDSNNNVIDRNDAYRNRGVDLNNGNGLSTEINDNIFSGNNCDTSVPNGLCIGK
jgi:nitrous oxidase accessory protein NosD